MLLVSISTQIYAIFGPLSPSLLRARRRREHGNILKNHWFLWVESHMRHFRATRPETEFQRKRVAKSGYEAL